MTEVGNGVIRPQAGYVEASIGLWFNDLLIETGLALKDVRLLRHQDTNARITPYRAWRDDRAVFEDYQSTMSSAEMRRSALRAPYWASFVGTPDGQTMFVGVYHSRFLTLSTEDKPNALRNNVNLAGTYDLYDVALADELRDYAGRLFVDWGPGFRSWTQRPDSISGNKAIVELRPSFREPEFPGYASFVQPLSAVEALPPTWASALQAVRGVYLLTCPVTREQYVGAAYGEGGFLGRWMQYVRNGHGGNVVLKSRDRSDYQVSILELASFATSDADVIAMEARWKLKLQSREMGLNAN